MQVNDKGNFKSDWLEVDDPAGPQSKYIDICELF